VILPQQISKEPLGPVVKRGDDEWFTLVRWVLFGLIEAEERGYTQANVRAYLARADPDTQRTVRISASFGRALGVGPDWALHVLEAVGNYGEMFDRNLGVNGPLKLERGLNRLWTQGGLMYSPPFR
jgi:general L-amino acid transport system substrate-binding protein